MPTLRSTDEDAAASLVESAPRICRLIQRAAIAFALIAAGSNLAAWLIPSFQSIAAATGMMIMRANMCLGALLAAGSLWLWESAAPRSVRARLAQGLGLLVFGLGAATALQDLAGVSFGLDELFAPGTFPGDAAAIFVTQAGRMSL